MEWYIPTFKNQHAFGPVELEVMASAYRQVCNHLKLSEDDVELRETVAAGIVSLARDGVGGADGLRDLYLAGTARRRSVRSLPAERVPDSFGSNPR